MACQFRSIFHLSSSPEKVDQLLPFTGDPLKNYDGYNYFTGHDRKNPYCNVISWHFSGRTVVTGRIHA